MTAYVVRVVDRGLVRGVPVVDVLLSRVDGGVRSTLLHSVGLNLSPASAEELAAGLGELGLRVEREGPPGAVDA